MSLEFVLHGEEYIITGYNGTPTEICIPSTYNGLPVTEIDCMAFSRSGDNPELDSITFEEPSHVWRIGSHAFFTCEHLTIVLPDSITDIEEGAFAGVGGILYKGKGIYFKGEPNAGTGDIGSTNGYYPYVHSTMWKGALIGGVYRGLTMLPDALTEPATAKTHTSILDHFVERSGGKRAQPRRRQAIHVLPRKR